MTFTFDRLIDQIIEGRKTATVERIDEQGYLDEWDTGLGIGYIYTVHDSNRVPRCKIKVMRLELCLWDSIPEWLWKGETNENADEFREDHLEYFGNPSPGFEFVGVEFELVEILSNAEHGSAGQAAAVLDLDSANDENANPESEERPL